MIIFVIFESLLVMFGWWLVLIAAGGIGWGILAAIVKAFKNDAPATVSDWNAVCACKITPRRPSPGINDVGGR